MLDLETAPSLIFVVEDQAILRLEAVTLLHEAGYETIEAATADAALEIMKERWHEVRVLFTDVQMPGALDGVDLAREVHRCWPNVLLLVTSADVPLSDDDLPDDARFIPKPYGGSSLIAQFRKLVAQGHTH